MRMSETLSGRNGIGGSLVFPRASGAQPPSPSLPRKGGGGHLWLGNETHLEFGVSGRASEECDQALTKRHTPPSPLEGEGWGGGSRHGTTANKLHTTIPGSDA